MTQGLGLQHVAALCYTDKTEKGKCGAVRLNVFFNSILMLAIKRQCSENRTYKGEQWESVTAWFASTRFLKFTLRLLVLKHISYSLCDFKY